MGESTFRLDTYKGQFKQHLDVKETVVRCCASINTRKYPGIDPVFANRVVAGALMRVREMLAGNPLTWGGGRRACYFLTIPRLAVDLWMLKVGEPQHMAEMRLAREIERAVIAEAVKAIVRSTAHDADEIPPEGGFLFHVTEDSSKFIAPGVGDTPFLTELRRITVDAFKESVRGLGGVIHDDAQDTAFVARLRARAPELGRRYGCDSYFYDMTVDVTIGIGLHDEPLRELHNGQVTDTGKRYVWGSLYCAALSRATNVYMAHFAHMVGGGGGVAVSALAASQESQTIELVWGLKSLKTLERESSGFERLFGEIDRHFAQLENGSLRSCKNCFTGELPADDANKTGQERLDAFRARLERVKKHWSEHQIPLDLLVPLEFEQMSHLSWWVEQHPDWIGNGDQYWKLLLKAHRNSQIFELMELVTEQAFPGVPCENPYTGDVFSGSGELMLLLYKKSAIPGTTVNGIAEKLQTLFDARPGTSFVALPSADEGVVRVTPRDMMPIAARVGRNMSFEEEARIVAGELGKEAGYKLVWRMLLRYLSA